MSIGFCHSLKKHLRNLTYCGSTRLALPNDITQTNHLEKQLCRVDLVISFPIQLDSTERLVVVEQSLGVFHQQRFGVADVVVACEVDGRVPLVQMYARIDRLLDLPTLSSPVQTFSR